MAYSREQGPSGARNLQMIVSEVVPSGRDLPTTQRRLGDVLQNYDNKLRATPKKQRPDLFASLLTPGFAGVQEFSLLVQRHSHQVEELKKGSDDSALRSIFRATLQSAMTEANIGLKRFGDGPWDDDSRYRREQWVKRQTKVQSLLDELGNPPED